MTKANIQWESKNVLIGYRAFLFCFGEKCMSGKIKEIQPLAKDDTLNIEVEFIEPSFFSNEALSGSAFTIREASNVLAKGVVI